MTPLQFSWFATTLLFLLATDENVASGIEDCSIPGFTSGSLQPCSFPAYIGSDIHIFVAAQYLTLPRIIH